MKLRALWLGLMLGGSIGCNPANQEAPPKEQVSRVVIAGSTALLPLVTEVANQFMLRQKNTAVEVEAGGSLTGIARVLDGSATIGMSDVAAQPAEATRLTDYLIASVGVVAMAHEGAYNRDIRSLTLAQLRRIFNGTIRDWSELGGQTQPLVVINRKPTSGTRAAFRSLVMGDDEFVGGEEHDSSSGVVTLLEQTPGAISYVALSYLRNTVKMFQVNDVDATVTNVANGTYPLLVQERLYTLRPPTPAAQAFVDYIQSDDVQRTLVTKNGFAPIRYRGVNAPNPALSSTKH